MIPSMGKVGLQVTRGRLSGRSLGSVIVSSDCMGKVTPNTVLRRGPTNNSGIGSNEAICLAIGTSDTPGMTVPSIVSGDSLHRTRTGLHTLNFGVARPRCVDNRGS